MSRRPLDNVLIVGASLAGLRAAQTLRSEGFEGRLQILGTEPHMPYDRPPLSKELLRGEADWDGVVLNGPDDLDAEWLLGEAAVALDTSARVVRTDRDRDLAYDGLVIATGSTPRRLPAIDPSTPGVLELRTLDDALRLREALRARPRVVLVGCGFIGVEVASTAHELGAHVELVTLDPPLAPAGEIISGTCAAMLADHGARLHLGRTVGGVEADDHGVTCVVLDDGTKIAADLVVSAVGAVPVTDWLTGSGLEIAGGVVCDASCAAAERVVAAGDVARWPNPLFGGEQMRIEHWSNAVEQGMAAARTLIHGPGSETEYAPVPSFWSDHFGTRLQSVGALDLADRYELVAGAVEEHKYIVGAYRGERLVAAVTYGMGRKLAPYRIKLARPEPLEAAA